MKIRYLEQKLEKSGYHFVRYGKGSHRIYQNPETRHTLSLSGRKGKDAKPYQLKFILQNE